MSICVPNFMQISALATAIIAKNPNPGWRQPPCSILPKNGLLGHRKPRTVSIYMPTKFDTNTFIGDRGIETKIQIQDGDRRHLEFPVTAISGPYSPRMANMNMQTKFGANRSIIVRRDTYGRLFSR